MDAERFDLLSRIVGAGTTRRAILAALGVAASHCCQAGDVCCGGVRCEPRAVCPN